MDERFLWWWDRYNCDLDVYNFPKESMEEAFIAGRRAGREEALNEVFQINGPSRAITRLRERWSL